MYYETSSGLSGYTEEDGSFDYNDGDVVVFKIGEVEIGQIDTTQIVDGQVFLQDIAGTERTDMSEEYVENMAVLLQSLDADGDAYNGIVITEAMHEAFSDESFDLATISEEDLVAIIEATGKEAVSEDAAMEHVEDMLELYGGFDFSGLETGGVDSAATSEADVALDVLLDTEGEEKELLFVEEESSQSTLTAGWETQSSETNAVVGQLQQEREEDQLTVASDGTVI
jgi:hypothetical protein